MLNVMPGSTPYQQYKKNAVETATPEKLLLMLFDGAIKFALQGKAAIEKKDNETANRVLLKLQDIFTELIVTLDQEKGGEIADNLNDLYVFYRNEVFKANVNKNANMLNPVIDFLHKFREVWQEAAKLARSEKNAK